MQTWPLLTNAPKNSFCATCLRVDVVEHDRGVVAAELERHALEVRRGAAMTRLPVATEPVNEILRTAAWRVIHVAEVVAAATIETPGGSDVAQDLAELQRRQRRERRRLQHDRVPGEQRRRDLASRQRIGKFHGVIAPTTPSGRRRTSMRRFAVVLDHLDRHLQPAK